VNVITYRNRQPNRRISMPDGSQIRLTAGRQLRGGPFSDARTTEIVAAAAAAGLPSRALVVKAQRKPRRRAGGMGERFNAIRRELAQRLEAAGELVDQVGEAVGQAGDVAAGVGAAQLGATLDQVGQGLEAAGELAAELGAVLDTADRMNMAELIAAFRTKGIEVPADVEAIRTRAALVERLRQLLPGS